MMKVKYIVAILFIGIATIAYTQIRLIAVKSGKGYVKLLKSVSQKILPHEPDAEAVMKYHFIVVWENEDAPLCFFWRGEGGWLPCNMEKAHKLYGKKYTHAKLPYKTEKISAGNIQKGDTLELTPVSGGKFPVPGDIPDDARNTLYFKTVNTNWLSLPVKK